MLKQNFKIHESKTKQTAVRGSYKAVLKPECLSSLIIAISIYGQSLLNSVVSFVCASGELKMDPGFER